MSSQGFVETDLQQPVTAESLETAEETLALDAEVPAPAAEAPAAPSLPAANVDDRSCSSTSGCWNRPSTNPIRCSSGSSTC